MRKSATPRTISAIPPQLGVRTEKPYSAMIMPTAPTTPGSTAPGWKISKKIPISPTRNRRLMRFGSMIVLRKLVKKPGPA